MCCLTTRKLRINLFGLRVKQPSFKPTVKSKTQKTNATTSKNYRRIRTRIKWRIENLLNYKIVTKTILIDLERSFWKFLNCL